MDAPADNIYNAPSQFSRRAFIVGSLAAAFALAVLPVSAETITTDASGLTVGEVKIPVEGGSIPGYRAMPHAGAPFPAILVVQEVFGVHEHIKDICRRLAKVGYFAVAPALYAREGDVAGMSDIKQIMQVVAKVPERQVASDLDATAAWAKSTGRADTSKLGIVGFCWGGRQVWLYAAHNRSSRRVSRGMESYSGRKTIWRRTIQLILCSVSTRESSVSTAVRIPASPLLSSPQCRPR